MNSQWQAGTAMNRLRVPDLMLPLPMAQWSLSQWGYKGVCLRNTMYREQFGNINEMFSALIVDLNQTLVIMTQLYF